MPSAHAWSRTQKVLVVVVTVVAIGAFVAFARSYERSHRLPDENILFGAWDLTEPHYTGSSFTLGMGDAFDTENHSHWHSGTWMRYDTAKQTEDFSDMTWYAGGSNIYMRFVDDPMPQIWEIIDVSSHELHLRHAKRDYVLKRRQN